MNIPSRAVRRFALVLAPLAAVLAAPSALAADAGIIPLPLNPVVPESQRACTARTASGLGYSELRAGDGAKPTDADYVLINYVGYLAASGQVFDQSMTSPMPVAGVIAGFGEGLKLMAKGAIYRICVPAALGYGERATGPIPANSDLVFQVELLDMRAAAEIEAMMRQPEAPPQAPE